MAHGVVKLWQRCCHLANRCFFNRRWYRK